MAQSLAEALHNPKNIELARQIRNRIKKELAALHGPPRKSRKINKRNLRAILVETAGMVNEIVQSGIGLPEIMYNPDIASSKYMHRQIKILIASQDMAEHEIRSAVAHEYCHHLQAVRSYFISSAWAGSEWFKTRAMTETLPRGLELAVARQCAEQMPICASGAMVNVRRDITIFLKQARTPLKEGIEDSLRHKHAYGAAAIFIAEERHGMGIYKELMHSHRPYGLLVEMSGVN